MENLTQLINLYRDDKRLKEAVAILEPGDHRKKIQFAGLTGGQEAFVLAGLYRALPRQYLVIAADKEEAAYLENDLSNLFESKLALFFPDSFKRPAYFEELNNSNVLQRTETINKMMASKAAGELVVTYPEALFEKVVAPNVLEGTRIDLVKGEDVDIDTIIEVLVEYGFERTDFVFEPGQFSIRGAIVDIFSYGNEWPYRIELFDEEIESIRLFDPTTQLSKRSISRVAIIPNINTRFSQDQKVPLTEILNEDAIVCVRDVQLLIDRLQTCFEEASAFAKKISALDESELAAVFRDRAFIRPGEIMEQLGRFSLLHLGTASQPFSFDKIINFSGKPQPVFNKNFKLLIENLNANTALGLENYIFTDNPKQIERFYAIFEDLQAQVAFHPIPRTIHQGFIDEVNRIACYTDHQIFERFHRYKLKNGFAKDQALNMRVLRELKPGDYITHIDHGIGKYSGLEKIILTGTYRNLFA